jgi:hypothetical protein
MKKLLLTLILAAAASTARAHYIGSIGFPMKDGGNALEFTYDTGSRDVEGSSGGAQDDLETNHLTLQYTRGVGNGLEFFGRLSPSGEAEFDDAGGDFDLFGLGAGVRWAPRQKGPFKFGLQASFDWSQGDDQDVDIDMKEFLFAGGGSYRVNKNVDVYGGLSFSKLDGTVEYPAVDVDFENSDTVGLFGGLDLKPGPNFTVGLELHLVSETLFAVTGRFKF